MNKLIVMDIDGVLADYEGKLVRVLVDKFGKRAVCDRTEYSLEKRYANKPDILEYALKLTSDPNFYYGISACEGSLDFVERLWDDDRLIIYISSRPQSAYNFTFRWLLRKTVGQVDLFCGVTDKAYFLKDLEVSSGIDFVVEDNPEEIKHLKKAGFTVLCFSQPWNEGIFPRLYVRNDGEVMLWADASVEAEPFFEQV